MDRLSLFRGCPYSVGEVQAVLNHFCEQGKYSIDIFFNDVVPMSETEAHCSLEGELCEGMNPLEFGSRYTISELSVSTSEVHVDAIFLLSCSTPMIAERIGFVMAEGL